MEVVERDHPHHRSNRKTCLDEQVRMRDHPLLGLPLVESELYMVRKRDCRLVSSAGAGDRMTRMQLGQTLSFQIDMLVVGKKHRKDLGIECGYEHGYGYVDEREKVPW